MAAVLLHVDELVREQSEAGLRAADDRPCRPGGEKDLPPENEGLRAEERRGEVREAAAAKTNALRIGPKS